MRVHDPRLKTVVVGDGPLRRLLAREFPDALFVGELYGERLASTYASGDLLLLPSRTETFGNVVLEAMASGLPVVAFDRAAAGDVVIDGSSGTLARATDDEAFLGAANRLAMDRNRLAVLGRNARRRAEACRWEAVTNALETVYVVAARNRLERLAARVESPGLAAATPLRSGA